MELPRFVRAAPVVALAIIVIVAALPHVLGAATDKTLQRVRGTVGYQTAANGSFTPVFGKYTLPDDNFAVTRAASAAVLLMPDSSLISLGENTAVQVGAFDTSATGPGSTITINGGSLRFDIKRPQGATANYHFVTTSSQIAIRGTIGLISLVNNVTTVGCLECQAGSLTVTTSAGQTFTLLTGQFLTVSATGAVVTGTLTSTIISTFGAAQVPTTAVATGAGAGLPAGVAGGIGASTAGIAGAAVLAGTAIGVAASVHSSASPAPTQTAGPQPSATPSPSPSPSSPGVPSPAPSGTQSGNVNLTSHATPAPAAAPVRAPAAIRNTPAATQPLRPTVPGAPLGPGAPRVPRS